MANEQGQDDLQGFDDMEFNMDIGLEFLGQEDHHGPFENGDRPTHLRDIPAAHGMEEAANMAALALHAERQANDQPQQDQAVASSVPPPGPPPIDRDSILALLDQEAEQTEPTELTGGDYAYRGSGSWDRRPIARHFRALVALHAPLYQAAGNNVERRRSLEHFILAFCATPFTLSNETQATQVYPRILRLLRPGVFVLLQGKTLCNKLKETLRNHGRNQRRGRAAAVVQSMATSNHQNMALPVVPPVAEVMNIASHAEFLPGAPVINAVPPVVDNAVFPVEGHPLEPIAIPQAMNHGAPLFNQVSRDLAVYLPNEGAPVNGLEDGEDIFLRDILGQDFMPEEPALPVNHKELLDLTNVDLIAVFEELPIMIEDL